MDIVILNRRGISYQRIKRGEQQALFIPSDENIKVYKDTAETHTIAERYGTNGSAPIWRDVNGQAVVYGVVPEVLSQRRQALKMWLPEDFAPRDSTAIMYVFDASCIVYGRREVDDEGKHAWRTTILKAGDSRDGLVSLVVGTLGELMVDEVESRVCVAVYEDYKLYEKLQAALEPLGIKPVPFSTLKPAPRLKPLYYQRDYGMLMALSVLLLGGAFAASVAYWFVGWTESNRLESNIEKVRRQIESIEVNKSIGQIREPKQVLQAMRKAFNQQPSAIMDAAARFGLEFGSLESVGFKVATQGEEGQAEQPVGLIPLQPGQHVMKIAVDKPTNKLLVDQERLAKVLLTELPWVRRVENIPIGPGMLNLDVVLQVEEEKLP